VALPRPRSGVGGVVPGRGPDDEETRPDDAPWPVRRSPARTDRVRQAAFAGTGNSIDLRRNTVTGSNRSQIDKVAAALEHCLPKAFGRL